MDFYMIYLCIGIVIAAIVYAALKGSGQTEIKYPFGVSLICVFAWPIPLLELLVSMMKQREAK